MLELKQMTKVLDERGFEKQHLITYLNFSVL